MKSDFIIAITQLAAERNLPREVVLSAVESALASAFKKDALAEAELVVRIQPASGDMKLFRQWKVVEIPEDPKKELTPEEAKAMKPGATVGDVIEKELPTPVGAGRIAAQTTKQVVMQRLREAERDLVYNEFVGKINDVVSGIVKGLEGRTVLVDLGRAEAVLPASEQVPTDRYRPGQRLKVLLLEANKSVKGTQLLVSRSHKNLLKRMFELEVPEVLHGAVEIKALAREPGFRSKVAVAARQEGVDAVGSCVGLRGMRIQNIVNELQGEKIDVVEWHRDPAVFIAKSLSPAQVVRVDTNQDQQTAMVVVPDRQLSLAIGKEGQNARLAAKLSGWHIDIKSQSQVEGEKLRVGEAVTEASAVVAPSAEAATPAPDAAPTAEVAVPEPVPVAPAAQATELAKPSEETPAAEPAPAGKSLEEALAQEELWKVARAAPGPKVRFAEDI
ncbi:MAG: transcription termination/antitermination protein NusA, partial [Chloroflexi bacterium]|nr:transcription termination/antitermination protein NusA [Chloroflexota bacterium]